MSLNLEENEYPAEIHESPLHPSVSTENLYINIVLSLPSGEEVHTRGTVTGLGHSDAGQIMVRFVEEYDRKVLTFPLQCVSLWAAERPCDWRAATFDRGGYRDLYIILSEALLELSKAAGQERPAC